MTYILHVSILARPGDIFQKFSSRFNLRFFILVKWSCSCAAQRDHKKGICLLRKFNRYFMSDFPHLAHLLHFWDGKGWNWILVLYNTHTKCPCSLLCLFTQQIRFVLEECRNVPYLLAYRACFMYSTKTWIEVHAHTGCS